MDDAKLNSEISVAKWNVLEKIAQKAVSKELDLKPYAIIQEEGDRLLKENPVFQECIKNGVRKINIATASFDAAANAAKSVTVTDKPNFFKISAAMADAVYENVKKHIKIFNMENLK